jgi:hypothetical protein
LTTVAGHIRIGVRRLTAVAEHSKPPRGWTLDQIREAVPTEGWSVEQIREFIPEAELLDPAAHFVVSYNPLTRDYEVLDAEVIIHLGGYCLLQSPGETSWWMGQLDKTDGSIVCWGQYGDELADAIWAL